MTPPHGTDRRAFLRTCAAGAATATLLSGTRHATAKRLAPPGRFFDIHTHLGQTWNSGDPLTAEVLLRWMDEHDVAQAAVLPLVSPEASSFPLTSDFVLAQTAPHRDRLIPFCSVDPRTAYTGGLKGLVSILRRYVEAGARGFGEHKPGVAIDDPRNVTLYAACSEVGLPLLLHIDNDRNLDQPGLPGLEKMLTQFPDCVFIGHGPGFWASISGQVTQRDLGGYPTGDVAPGGALDRLMDQHANLYADLSAGSGAGAIRRDLKFGQQFLTRRADRVLFGTDYLSPGQEVFQFDLASQLELPEDVRAKIFRDNARRLLKLS